MSVKTKKQHYVWEYYLLAWATDHQIWCQRDNKIFQTSTENVAQERYFYEIEQPTNLEILLIEELLNYGGPLARETNLQTFRTFLLAASSGNDSRRFGMEWHHGIIEEKALPIMETLAAGDDAPLRDEEQRINLAIFMGQQYTRTKKVRKSFTPLRKEQVPEEYKECNFQKAHEILCFVFANNIGAHIFERLELRLIRNTSSISLITSDQPIYNLQASPGVLPTSVELYYPISPRLALMARNPKTNPRKISSNEEAMELNIFSAKNSHEFIFSSQKEDLEQTLNWTSRS